MYDETDWMNEGVERAFPAGPLVEYVARRGGAGAFYPGVTEEIDRGNGNTFFTITRTAADTTAIATSNAQLAKWTERGHVSLADLDAFCCDVMKVHPAVVYGDAYFYGFSAEESEMDGEVNLCSWSWIPSMKVMAALGVTEKTMGSRRKSEKGHPTHKKVGREVYYLANDRLEEYVADRSASMAVAA